MSLLINAAVAHLNRQCKPTKASDEFLTEELSDKHKSKIANMPSVDRSIKAIHDKVFGEGNDTIEIPYSRENDEKITSSNYRAVIGVGGFNSHLTHHNSVFNHLHRNGYDVTDYVKGLAKKRTSGDEPDSREEKIGKILQRTEADDVPSGVLSNPTYKRVEKEDGTSEWARDHRGAKIVDKPPRTLSVAQAFANDPIRAAKKDVKLVVSRSKEGVGGMSTGKGWTSCMNLDDGCNRHYVPHEIQQGTITAYLVRKGDEKSIDNPVGRVNLKQFSDGNTAHKIFRPESNIYGAMPRSAHKAVSDWAESVYPHKENAIYNKHPELYNDDGKSLFITGNPTHENLAHNVDHHVQKIMNAYEDRRNNMKYQDDHGDDYLSNHIENYLDALPNTHRDNLTIHHRLTSQENPDDMWEGDMSAGDHIAKWAKDRSVSWNGIHDTDLMHHLNTAEENSKFGHNYDSDMLDDATYTHHKLFNEALRRGSPETKDKAISHMLDNHHNDWYQNMDNQYGSETPHLHQYTNNPANIKKIYEVSKEGNFHNTIPEFDDMDGSAKTELSRKLGKHGDDDVLHDYVHSDHYDQDFHPTKAFHEGMNERKDGEERQHKLMSELNLGGGSGTSDIASITATNQLYNAQRGYHRHTHEDVGNNDLYANIARHTKFPSVHATLKSRTDTQTPEIQAAVKENQHLN